MAKVTEQLCGFEVSVSRYTQLHDKELTAPRQRELAACPYVALDARCGKVRHRGRVIDCAVLVALGVRTEGERDVLGVSVALSEAEVHGRQFLADLNDRGLHRIELFVADDHGGLKAGRRAVFPWAPWRRCQFHLQQNVVHYVSCLDRCAQIVRDIRAVFNAPNMDEAKHLLDLFVKRYAVDAPKAAEWAEAAPLRQLAIHPADQGQFRSCRI